MKRLIKKAERIKLAGNFTVDDVKTIKVTMENGDELTLPITPGEINKYKGINIAKINWVFADQLPQNNLKFINNVAFDLQNLDNLELEVFATYVKNFGDIQTAYDYCIGPDWYTYDATDIEELGKILYDEKYPKINNPALNDILRENINYKTLGNALSNLYGIMRGCCTGKFIYMPY